MEAPNRTGSSKFVDQPSVHPFRRVVDQLALDIAEAKLPALLPVVQPQSPRIDAGLAQKRPQGQRGRSSGSGGSKGRPRPLAFWMPIRRSTTTGRNSLAYTLARSNPWVSAYSFALASAMRMA